MRFASISVALTLLVSLLQGQVLPPLALNPPKVAVDSGELRLTVSGFNFVPTSQVLWNGQARVTQFVDSRTLKATITSDDVSRPDFIQVSVADSNTGAAISDSTGFFVFVPLPAYDLIYDPQRARVYVTVSQQHPNGPSLAIVEPEHGFVERYIPLPAEPGVLAISDDSRYLYVALQDRIRRMDLTESTGDLDIPLSSDNFPVWSMVPLPGQGRSVAISAGYPFGESRVFIVDDQNQRAHGSGGGPCLAVSQDGSTIYGSLGDGNPFDVYKVDGGGIVFPWTWINFLVDGPSCPILVSGLLYDSAGDIIDLTGPSIVGSLGAWGLVRPVPELHRTYFVGSDSITYPTLNPPIYLKVFDNTTQEQLQSIPLPVTMNLFNGRLIQWGSNGLGFGEFPTLYPGNRPVPSSRIYLFHPPPQQ